MSIEAISVDVIETDPANVRAPFYATVAEVNESCDIELSDGTRLRVANGQTRLKVALKLLAENGGGTVDLQIDGVGLRTVQVSGSAADQHPS